MPLAPRRNTLCLLLTIAVASGSAGADKTPTAAACAPTGAAAEADKGAILKVIADMQEAWNRGDFRGYMQGFKNPDVIFVSGVRPQHPQYGINTRLMRKVNGQWVIALNHVSSSESAPAPPRSTAEAAQAL